MRLGYWLRKKAERAEEEEKRHHRLRHRGWGRREGKGKSYKSIKKSQEGTPPTG
jgi:hypothetical protein